MLSASQRTKHALFPCSSVNQQLTEEQSGTWWEIIPSLFKADQNGRCEYSPTDRTRKILGTMTSRKCMWTTVYISSPKPNNILMSCLPTIITWIQSNYKSMHSNWTSILEKMIKNNGLETIKSVVCFTVFFVCFTTLLEALNHYQLNVYQVAIKCLVEIFNVQGYQNEFSMYMDLLWALWFHLSRLGQSCSITFFN